MAESPHVPNHPDAAIRWLTHQLKRTAPLPPEDLPEPHAAPVRNWLTIRQRLEFELARYVVRPLL